MFQVSDRPSALPAVALEDFDAHSRAIIAPTRGGMATHFFANGREWLFLDESTLFDPQKNVRGGVPILFPSPGRLENDALSRDGARGTLKQHGFARNLPWAERGRSTGNAARLELELADTAETRAQFPWPFRVRLAYVLRGAVLRLEIAIENTGTEPLPFGFGLHPYFHVLDSEKSKAEIPTRARAGWDNAAKRNVAVEKIDLCAKETDLHLFDHGGSAAELRTVAGAIEVRGSPEFSRWVVWQLQGKDFVCLEPWTCPGNALNSGDGLIQLAPGAHRDLWVEIAARR